MNRANHETPFPPSPAPLHVMEVAPMSDWFWTIAGALFLAALLFLIFQPGM